MRNKTIVRLLVCCVCLFASSVLLAHHSAAGEDQTNVVTFTGVITQLEWTNPHIRIHVDVKNGGKTENWSFGWGAVSAVSHLGVTQETLKPGQQVTIQAYLYKPDSSYIASMPSKQVAEAGCITLTEPSLRVATGHGPPCVNPSATPK